MVGFVSEPTNTITKHETEDCDDQSLKLKTLKDPLENFDSKFSDLSFADSLLDFDFISEFLDDNSETGRPGRSMENNNNGSSVNSHFEGSNADGSDPIMKVNSEKLELHSGGNLDSCIDKDMRRVSLVGRLNSTNGDDGAIGEGEKVEVDISHVSSSVEADMTVTKAEVEVDETVTGNVGWVNLSSVSGNEIIVDGEAMKNKDDAVSESDYESEDTSSSSSSSSASSCNNSEGDEDNDEETEEEDKEKAKANLEKNTDLNVDKLEDGEIAECKDDDAEEVDKMVGWDDIELEEEEDAGAIGGPIRSKNELQDLPPVPPVNVTLEPHHQMLPGGVALSILGAQVIVGGAQKHNPLSEGSLLWITESGSPLGWVDEIFGPVKNPYYVVRYNSESEVPTGFHAGSSISFVAEFVNHVLNDQNIYKKGYDASGENDEEISDEVEFSDDEKEAEYKRKLAMSKRSNNDQMVRNKGNNRKKGKNRDRNWNKNKSLSDQTPASMGSLLTNQNKNNVSPVDAGASTSGAGFVQLLSTMKNPTSVFRPPNGSWGEGVNSQQSMNAVFPLGFPPNNMPWPPQIQLQLPYQIPIPNSVPFQQFSPTPAPLPNAALFGGQPLFLGGPAFSSWSGALSQNPFNQTSLAMGFESQPPQFMNVMNMGDQEVTSSFSSAERNFGRISGDPQAQQHFNMGSRGKKQHHRRGGLFAVNRGRGRSK